jgi:hypothetical protein
MTTVAEARARVHTAAFSYDAMIVEKGLMANAVTAAQAHAARLAGEYRAFARKCADLEDELITACRLLADARKVDEQL